MVLIFPSTKGNNSVRQTRDTTTKTGIAYSNSTWRASKYKVQKLHQRYILKKGCPQWHRHPPFQARSATQGCTGVRQNQFLFETRHHKTGSIYKNTYTNLRISPRVNCDLIKNEAYSACDESTKGNNNARPKRGRITQT